MNHQDDTKPLVSAAELEALIQGWGASPHKSVDRFFPLRFWYIFSVILIAAVWLLFNTQDIAKSLTEDPDNLIRLQNFLYFRGWFLLIVLVIGCYAYFRSWYTALVFSAFLLLGLTNLVFDLFTVYPERLARPSPFFTLFLLVRLAMLWSVFLTVKNASRLPEEADRINVLLPFRKKMERGAEG